MADTSIEWVRGNDGSKGMSWNALRAEREIVRKGKTITVSAHHCEHVNEACRFCYADRTNPRLGGLPFKPGHRKDYRFVLDWKKLLAPLKRRKPTRIFVESMSDAFGEWWPIEFVHKIYAVMALSPQHTLINLSKRPERRRRYLDDAATEDAINLAMEQLAPAHWCKRELQDYGGLPLKNVIEGTSVSNQAEADEFVPILLRTRAALWGLSIEPMLGPIDLMRWMPRGRYYNAICERCGHTGSTEHFHESRNVDDADVVCPKCNQITLANEIGRLSWVIVGGESGHKARPMHPQWARDIRDQCATAGVPFFYKQTGEWLQRDCVHISRAHAIFNLDGSCTVGVGAGTAVDALRTHVVMERVGKKAAGRLLDGREHNGFPEVRL